MNVLTLTGHLVTDAVRRITTRGLVCEFRLASKSLVAHGAGGS